MMDFTVNALMAYLVWLQYMQHNDARDYRFYGTVSEGLELTTDWMNGFGCTYVAGPFGCNVPLLGIMDKEAPKQGVPSRKFVAANAP